MAPWKKGAHVKDKHGRVLPLLQVFFGNESWPGVEHPAKLCAKICKKKVQSTKLGCWGYESANDTDTDNSLLFFATPKSSWTVEHGATAVPSPGLSLQAPDPALHSCTAVVFTMVGSRPVLSPNVVGIQ